MRVLLLLAVGASGLPPPDGNAYAEATPRALTFATVPHVSGPSSTIEPVFSLVVLNADETEQHSDVPPPVLRMTCHFVGTPSIASVPTHAEVRCQPSWYRS